MENNDGVTTSGAGDTVESSTWFKNHVAASQPSEKLYKHFPRGESGRSSTDTTDKNALSYFIENVLPKLS